ncbi:hypothetical protein Hte_003173 [Hypoxylon texense]
MQFQTIIAALFVALAAARPKVETCADGTVAKVPVPLDARDPNPQGPSVVGMVTPDEAES